MTDHAKVVRNWMAKNHHQLDDELGSSVPSTTAYNGARAALAALKQELTDARNEVARLQSGSEIPALRQMVLNQQDTIRDTDAKLAEAKEALTQLRDAWNVHMATCPSDVPAVTWAQIETWKNAPSDTASSRPWLRDASPQNEGDVAAFSDAQSATTKANRRRGGRMSATLGQLRELTDDLPDDTPLVVVIRKAHDPDRFYEAVLAEEDPHISLTHGAQVIITAPEPKDFDA